MRDYDLAWFTSEGASMIVDGAFGFETDAKTFAARMKSLGPAETRAIYKRLTKQTDIAIS